MNARQLAKVLEFYEVTDFDGQLAILSGELADLVHNTIGQVYTDMKSAAALVGWQCRQFNGEWDMKAVNETHAWLSTRITILDFDEAVKTLPVKRATRKAAQIRAIAPLAPIEPRFANLEV